MALVHEQSLRPILIQFVMKSFKTNFQHFSGASFVVAGLIQRPKDHLSLDLFQWRSDGKRHGIFRAEFLSLVERVRCKVMPLDLLAGTNHDGALNHVAQFAHVPRPCVKAQRIESGWTDKSRRPVVLRRETRNQMLS